MLLLILTLIKSIIHLVIYLNTSNVTVNLMNKNGYYSVWEFKYI